MTFKSDVRNLAKKFLEDNLIDAKKDLVFKFVIKCYSNYCCLV